MPWQYKQGRFREDAAGAKFSKYGGIIEPGFEEAWYRCCEGNPLVKAFAADPG
jgi:hypothetical protein